MKPPGITMTDPEIYDSEDIFWFWLWHYHILNMCKFKVKLLYSVSESKFWLY